MTGDMAWYGRVALETVWMMREARREREQRDVWRFSFIAPQDAPALGYTPSLDELFGAVPVLDGGPPTVTRPDPIADLVKAYRLIRDHPEYP